MLNRAFVLIFLFFTSPAYSFDWYAFGELRGHIEPCGCDPATDLGGVVRLGSYFEERKKGGNQSKIFDLGNNIFSDSNHLLKNKYIGQALEKIELTASLVNTEEYSEIERILELDIPFVLSNSSNRQKGLKEIIINDDIAVFGYLAPLGQKGLQGYSEKLLTRWKELVRKAKVHKKVLLFSGEDGELGKFYEANFFDLIISNNVTLRETIFVDEEKKSEGLLLRMNRGKGIYMVPVGGQGVLLGGKNQNPLPTRAGIFETSKCMPIKTSPSIGSSAQIQDIGTKCTTAPDGFPIFPTKKIVHWLGVGSSHDQVFDKIMTKYQEQVAYGDQIEALQLSKSKGVSQYVGDLACKKCHQFEWKKWSESSHAKAFATLEHKSREKNPDCAVCHTVAYRQEGGFISKKFTAHLTNVQCENCHGPAKEHVQRPKKKSLKLKNARDACSECHVPNHSPRFEPEAYWEKIKH